MFPRRTLDYNRYMIYCVALNPSLDYHVFTDTFTVGELNRTQKELLLPGGKAINVAQVMKDFGYDCVIFGFTAGSIGREIRKLVRAMGLKDEMSYADSGMSRINLKIHAKEETELNGTGPLLTEDDIRDLMEKLDSVKDGDVLILSGSIPPSVPRTIYADILKRVSGKKILTAVDSTGDLLTCTLPFRPFVVKPNHKELGDIFGKRIDTREEAVPYARLLQEQGARNVLVSLAEEGAVLLTEEGNVFFCNAPEGKAVNTIGSGDSMLAGFLYGMMEKNDHEYALRTGIAAGSACAFSEGLATKNKMLELLDGITSYTSIMS